MPNRIVTVLAGFASLTVLVGSLRSQCEAAVLLRFPSSRGPRPAVEMNRRTGHETRHVTREIHDCCGAVEARSGFGPRLRLDRIEAECTGSFAQHRIARCRDHIGS